MINLTTDTPLRILLTSNNTALAEAIRHATPEQLALLKEGTDIRGVLDAIAGEAARSTKSHTVLREILANAPAFKEMGNLPETLKQLVSVLESRQLLPELKSRLAAFLKPLGDTLPADALRSRINDSGIFLESKLAASAAPLSELKPLLLKLDALLAGSDRPVAAALRREIAALLETAVMRSPNVPEDPKTLRQLSAALERILAPLKGMQQRSDVLQGEKAAALTERLGQFVRMVRPEASAPETGAASLAAEKFALPARQELQHFAWVKERISRPETPQSVRTELQTAPERYILTALKELVGELHGLTLESSRPESRSLIDLLGTLFLKLGAKSSDLRTLLQDEGFNRTLAALSERLESFAQRSDPLIGREASRVLRELASFSQPERLMPGAAGERIADDFKAVLLQSREQLATTPSSSDLTRQVDRMLLQIDYYQLSSCLSNTTALFFPYSWEMLDEGSLLFKKGKERTFYCRINLTLKAYGEIHLMLALKDEKKIDVQAYTESGELRGLLGEALPVLRAAFRDAGLLPGKLRIDDLPKQASETKGYDGGDGDLQMGFEVTI